MDVIFNGVARPDGSPVKLLCVMSGTAAELSDLARQIDAAVDGKGNTHESSTSTGVPLRVIIDRVGPAPTAQ